jgi:hypothetical protein
MTIANTAQRAHIIQGLRDLADFLQAHPEVPVQPYTTRCISYYPAIDNNDEAADCAEVTRVAALLGVDPAWNHNGTQYIAVKRFGLITYEAVAITAASMAAHDAVATYHGHVTP